MKTCEACGRTTYSSEPGKAVLCGPCQGILASFNLVESPARVNLMSFIDTELYLLPTQRDALVSKARSFGLSQAILGAHNAIAGTIKASGM